MEYINDFSDPIGPWFDDGYKPQEDYFKASLEASVEDLGSEYLLTYSH